MLYAGLFFVSFAMLFAFVYWTADVLATSDRRTLILADVEGLAESYQEGGIATLADAIEERVQPDRVGERIYLLVDADFSPLAGNITSWPTIGSTEEDWIEFPIGKRIIGDPEQHAIEASVVNLAGGYHLLVGRDTGTEVRFKQAIKRAIVASLAIMLAMGVIGGLVMSRVILRRIDTINQSAERIMQGEVRHRMPVRGRDDEFDRLAENLNAMLEEIERLMGSIRAVTNNIAHDLRSPLNRVRNRLEAALSADQDPAERSEAIERAIGEADDLLATFNALLSIADAEAGTGRSALQPVDLCAVASDVAELYGPLVEEQGLAFDRSIAGAAMVSGNRQLLFQAIANLIDNAAKYGAAGGRVSLSVGPGADGPEITVSDRGPGIPEADQSRVLERFVRLDASRSTPGNGLGLSLVAAIARLHGAQLSLGDNSPGLTVTLRFKAASSS